MILIVILVTLLKYQNMKNILMYLKEIEVDKNFIKLEELSD